MIRGFFQEGFELFKKTSEYEFNYKNVLLIIQEFKNFLFNEMFAPDEINVISLIEKNNLYLKVDYSPFENDIPFETIIKYSDEKIGDTQYVE